MTSDHTKLGPRTKGYRTNVEPRTVRGKSCPCRERLRFATPIFVSFQDATQPCRSFLSQELDRGSFSQPRIDRYFMTYHDNRRVAAIKSKRLRTAVEDLSHGPTEVRLCHMLRFNPFGKLTNKPPIIYSLDGSEQIKLELTTLTFTYFHAHRVSIYLLRCIRKITCISQLANMSIDPKCIELTADVFRLFSKLSITASAIRSNPSCCWCRRCVRTAAQEAMRQA